MPPIQESWSEKEKKLFISVRRWCGVRNLRPREVRLDSSPDYIWYNMLISAIFVNKNIKLIKKRTENL